MPKKTQVLALLELGWSDRRIEAETGVRRETVSRYDEARQANAAKTFPGSAPRHRFAAAIYRTTIREKLDAGLSLRQIWQDLVEEYGYGASYEPVRRFVHGITADRLDAASLTARFRCERASGRRTWGHSGASMY